MGSGSGVKIDLFETSSDHLEKRISCIHNVHPNLSNMSQTLEAET